MSQAIEQAKQAFAAFEVKDFARAETIARAILAANGSDPNALMVMGAICGETDRRAEAVAWLEKADQAAPGQPLILKNLGMAKRLAGDAAGALAALQGATRSAPKFDDAWFQLGVTQQTLGDAAAAEASYRQAIALNPSRAEPMGKLAGLLETQHRLDQAAELADRALALDPANALANLARAEVDLRREAYGAAESRMAGLLERGLTPVNRASAENIRARALDRADRPAEAFAAYGRSNDVMYETFRARFESGRSAYDARALDMLTRFCKSAPFDDAAPCDDPQPAFLVGFPRSGTTLLDQILSAHPDVETIEEQDLLVDTLQAFLIDGAPGDLANADADQLRFFRMRYRERLNTARRTPDRALVIDKQPLNLAFLGLIRFLFPDAKVLLVLRDPRDSVLSCFQQSFTLNAAMFEYLTLDRAARFYDRVMTIGAQCRTRSMLAIHPVKYEDVVSDFETTTRAALAFLGLDWREEIRDYRDGAKKRAIATPSARQVVQPLYTSAISKWKRYEAQMAPVLPGLTDWAERLGYPR